MVLKYLTSGTKISNFCVQRERRRHAAHRRCARGDEGTQFTCFTGTQVQTLTQKLAPQVIHRACKDVLEESKVLSLLALLVQKSANTDGEDAQGAHAEYRHLKVALAETEASVKYMMLHCSNEASFAFCPDSGTEAGQYILVFVSILVKGLKYAP